MKLTRDALKQIIKEELEEMISDKGTAMELGGPLGGSLKTAEAQLANLGLQGPLNIGGKQFAFMVSPQDQSVLKLYDYRSAVVGAKTYVRDVSSKDPEIANALRQIRENKKRK